MTFTYAHTHTQKILLVFVDVTGQMSVSSEVLVHGKTACLLGTLSCYSVHEQFNEKEKQVESESDF